MLLENDEVAELRRSERGDKVSIWKEVKMQPQKIKKISIELRCTCYDIGNVRFPIDAEIR